MMRASAAILCLLALTACQSGTTEVRTGGSSEFTVSVQGFAPGVEPPSEPRRTDR